MVSDSICSWNIGALLQVNSDNPVGMHWESPGFWLSHRNALGILVHTTYIYDNQSNCPSHVDFFLPIVGRIHNLGNANLFGRNCKPLCTSWFHIPRMKHLTLHRSVWSSVDGTRDILSDLTSPSSCIWSWIDNTSCCRRRIRMDGIRLMSHQHESGYIGT